MTTTQTKPLAAGGTPLAVGIVALEFAAAVSTFVSSTLLPTVARDLHARNQLGLLVAGSTLGLFVALPFAARVVRRLGPRRTLTLGLLAYFCGLAITATSRAAFVFAVGQVIAGFASGLLAVFGISSAIQQLDDALRVRVVAASSAMWILPAVVGPAITLAFEHLVGWRWTLLLPVPVILVGRLLVVRAAQFVSDTNDQQRPVGQTLLVPVGVAALVLSSDHTSWWPIAVAGVVIALVGVVLILPEGTVRLRSGTPAALGAMLLFATGYFGAGSLITVLLTSGFHTSVARAAVVLSAAPLGWALTSLIVPRLRDRGREPAASVGLALAATGVATLTATLTVSTAFGPALASWAVTGIGIGLAYPVLYLACTSVDASGLDATRLATAVITAEAFGELLGRAGGGAVISLTASAGASRTHGLVASYTMFTLFLVAAAIAATRAVRRA